MNTMTVIGKAYQIVRLLGKGKGGYSYLVTDGINQYTLNRFIMSLAIIISSATSWNLN